MVKLIHRNTKINKGCIGCPQTMAFYTWGFLVSPSLFKKNVEKFVTLPGNITEGVSDSAHPSSRDETALPQRQATLLGSRCPLAGTHVPGAPKPRLAPNTLLQQARIIFKASAKTKGKACGAGKYAEGLKASCFCPPCNQVVHPPQRGWGRVKLPSAPSSL